MPRKPRVRVNYLADAQYLERLAFAVGEDDRLSPYDRRQLVESIQGLVNKFREASPDVEKTQETRKIQAEGKEAE